MKATDFGDIILNEQDIFDGLYSGKITNLRNVNIDSLDTVAKFNIAVQENADPIPLIGTYKNIYISQEDFDRSNQEDWFMPEDYCPNLVEMLYGLCETPEQTDRVSQEIELFIQHGMYDLLYYLKYLVDTLRANNIVWGVGRGSSVASYVLYLIGVHKIDSIKYELDINEFLK
jgi:DNA polymerase III alpha subunit